ncbi:MAG: hypothetical protein ACE5IZ_08130, partial [Dehalococcoidia bacterium]
ASLLSIIASFVLAPFHPLGVAVALVPFGIGYLAGRSTSVPIDSTDAFSPRVDVRDTEYGYRAAQFSNMMRSQAAEDFLSSDRMPVPDQLSVMATWYGFGLFRNAPSLALSATWLYLAIWSLANWEGKLWETSSALLFLLSLPYGTAIGLLVKHVAADPGRPKAG